LELLHEALPGARRIAVLADHEPIRNIRALESAALGFGIEIVPFAAAPFRCAAELGRYLA